MAEDSSITWCHHTFNPWIGCTRISAACDHCYAEVWDRRWKGGDRWGGPHAARTRTSAGNWARPITWNHKAMVSKERKRVFCASLADVFDNHRSISAQWRNDLWALIQRTPNLDWLLLTKRAQNISRFLPEDWGPGYANVWLGTTIENQVEYDRRVHHLTAVPARLRFLSMEPLLGPVDLRGASGLHWIIAGGESGAKFRAADPEWFRVLRDQCDEIGLPFLFKQWSGSNQKIIKSLGRSLDGIVHDAIRPETDRFTILRGSKGSSA